MVVDLPLAFLGYGGLLFVFLCYFFRFDRIVHLKMSSMGEWPSQRVVDRMIFGRFFHLFLIDFGSQIYTSPANSDWHVPPSHVPRRLPPLPPQDPVVSIVGYRSVVPTRLGALCSFVRVRATLRLFQAAHGSNRFYGVGSSSVWFWWRCVSYTRLRSAEATIILLHGSRAGKTGHPTQPVKIRDPFSIDTNTTRLC